MALQVKQIGKFLTEVAQKNPANFGVVKLNLSCKIL